MVRTRSAGPAKRIAAGPRIANRSVNHPYFTGLSDADIRAQLANLAKAIRTTTGAGPAPLFRFPYGDRDARTIAVVNGAGYVPIRRTVDSLGWQGMMSGSGDAGFVVHRVVAAATPGEIVHTSTYSSRPSPRLGAGSLRQGHHGGFPFGPGATGRDCPRWTSTARTRTMAPTATRVGCRKK